MPPIFSVIIPCYNCAKYIQSTLASVYNQSYSDFEVIVINDGSTDETADILKSQQDQRLNVITIENSGECQARNTGIKYAKGKYLAFLDADDIWHPQHLQQAHNILENNDAPNWYSSRCQMGTIVDEEWLQSNITQNVVVVNYFTNKQARLTSSSSTVIKRASINDTSLFPKGVKLAGDTIGWANYAVSSEFIAINLQPTVFYRQHDHSVSHVRQKTLQQDAEIFKTLLIHLYDLRIKHPSNRSLDIYTCKQFLGCFRLLAPKMCYSSYNPRCSFRSLLGYLFCYLLCYPIFIYNALKGSLRDSEPSTIQEIRYARNVIYQHFNYNKTTVPLFFRLYVYLFLRCNSLTD